MTSPDPVTVNGGAAPGKPAEREAQRAYWKEHSSEATVESMMLDSKAKDIDRLERPEVCIARRRPISSPIFDHKATHISCGDIQGYGGWWGI
jgi:hypothetical protein